MMSPKAHKSTERRHREALALDAKSPSAVSELLGFLGDPSWRVRKAALGRIDEFQERPTLLVELIACLGDETNAGLRAACAEALLRMRESVEILLQALRTQNTNQRKIVVEILGGLGTPKARERLIAMLDDPDANARSAAAEALGRIGGGQVVGELRKRLQRSDDLQQTIYLLDALGRTRASLPFEELEPFLAQRALARGILPVLALSGDRRAIEPLRDALCAVSGGTRRAAILALRQGIPRWERALRESWSEAWVTDGAVAAALDAGMEDEDEEVSAAAVWITGALGDPRAAPRMLPAVASRSFLEEGLSAIQALGPGVVGPLLEALPALDADARVLALEIVEVLGDAEAALACREVALSDDLRAAEAAIRVMGAHGDLAVLPLLAQQVERTPSELTAQTALALAAVGKRHPEEVLKLARERIVTNATLWVWPFLLGTLGQEEDLPRLLQALHSPVGKVRAAALQAVAPYESAVPTQVFVEALGDPEPTVRAASARSLVQYPRQGVEKELLAALHDDDPWTVAEVVRALGQCAREPGADAAIMDAISLAVQHPASSVVMAALHGLAELAPSHLETVVRRSLEHADPEVVREALSATRALPQETACNILLGQLGHERWDVRRRVCEILVERKVVLSRRLWQQYLALEPEPLVRSVLERVVVAEEASP